MSKGIGAAQRKAIEATGCNSAIWDHVPSLCISVAHNQPATVNGVELVLRDGITWKRDGKPWYSVCITVHSCEEYLRAVSQSLNVTLARGSDGLDDAWYGTCAFTMPRVYEAFGGDIWGDRREYQYNSRGNWVPMNPPEVNAARNRVKATVSRAFKKAIDLCWIAYLGYEYQQPWHGNAYAFMVPPSQIIENYANPSRLSG